MCLQGLDRYVPQMLAAEYVVSVGDRELGRKGGKATGKCKVRGDHAYYVNLRLKGQQKKEKKP